VNIIKRLLLVSERSSTGQHLKNMSNVDLGDEDRADTSSSRRGDIIDYSFRGDESTEPLESTISTDTPKLPIVGSILKRIEQEEAIVEREEKFEDEHEPKPQRTTFKLCTVEETPEFLRRPFITNHYRVYFSFNLCFARYVFISF
jgi:arsenate reductase-like glutaredoxin family protein